MAGVQERITTQTQADYSDVSKGLELITGPQGFEARRMFKDNFTASAGLVTSLATSGALASNPIVKVLADIDKQTQAQRTLDAQTASNKISTENFNNTEYGKIWTGLKFASRIAGLVGNTVLQGFNALGSAQKKVIDAYGVATQEGQINSWGIPTTNAPISPKLQAKLDQIPTIKEVAQQLTAYQALVEQVKTGKIDLGEGFIPSEEIGAGFAARNAALKFNKVSYTGSDGIIKYRPYSMFDPLTNFLTSTVNPEGNTQRFVNTLAEIGVSFATDPSLIYSKLAQKAKEVRLIAESTAGIKGAKAAVEASMLESQLKTATDRTAASLKAIHGVETPTRSKINVYLNNYQNKMRLTDEFGNIKIDYDGIANFLSGPGGAHIIDGIANETDFIKMQKLAHGKLKLEEAKALAAASTREEVLKVIAPYIANGNVVQRAFESGNILTNTIRKTATALESTTAGKRIAKFAEDYKIGDAFSSVISKGDIIRVKDAISGANGRAFERNKLLKGIFWAAHGIHMFGRKYNALLPQTGGQLIQLSDKDQLIGAVNNIARYMKLDSATTNAIIREIAYSTDDAQAGMLATSKLFNHIFDKYSGKFSGQQLEDWKKATRVFETERLNMSRYWAQMHATGTEINTGIIDGAPLTIHSAHLDSELLNSSVFMPDPKAMMDYIKSAQKFKGLPTGKAKVGVIDIATDLNSLWKKTVLVRPAYITRNIIEEQIRVFGSGHISFFNHPLSAMAMWLGRDLSSKKWRRMLAMLDDTKHDVYGSSLKGATSKEEFLQEEIAGDLINPYVSFLNDHLTGMGGDGEMNKTLKSLGYTSEVFGHPSWWDGMASQIRILHNSDFVQRILATKPGEEMKTVEYFLKGEGRKTLDRFINSKDAITKKQLTTKDGLMQYLFTGQNEKGQLVSVLARINELTGKEGKGSALLKELLVKGSVKVGQSVIQIPNGKMAAAAALKTSSSVNKGKRIFTDLNSEFAKTLKSAFSDSGNWDGVFMTIPQMVEKSALTPKKFNQLAKYFFDIAVKFEKNSTMGPEWRQSYWDAIHNISGALDNSALSALQTNAKESLSALRNPITGNNIGNTHKVWKALDKADGSGPLTLDEAHQYAVNIANNTVANLFYDASKRNLLWHQLRLIAPFGQAWEDTMKRWAEIGTENPIQVYKAIKVGNWLSSKSSSALYEATDAKSYYDPNQGFFFSDPTTGEKKFFVPFAGTAINILQSVFPDSMGSRTTGAFALSATPQSFNFASGGGSILPGFGQGISWTVSALDAINKNPMKILPAHLEETIFKYAFPYGTPDMKSSGLLDNPLLTSNWVRTIGGLAGVEKTFSSAFAPSMGYLASSGEYDLLNPQDQVRLVKDGHNLAQYFSMWRGIFGALMPMPFPLRPEALAKDNNGDTVLATSLWANFKNIELNASSKSAAYKDFFDTYGPEQVFAIIKSTTGFEPTNLPTYSMIKADPKVLDLYPEVYGYFYPNGELSKVLYQFQQSRVNPQRKSAKEVMNMATNILYTAAKERMLTRSIGENWDANQYTKARQNLDAAYTTAGLVLPPQDTQWQERAIAQIIAAADDPKLADSGALIGARAYIIQRQKALDASGMSTLGNKKSEPQRVWLGEEALRLIKKYPDFQKIFYGVFKNELKG